jgi:hypothetical protein
VVIGQANTLKPNFLLSTEKSLIYRFGLKFFLEIEFLIKIQDTTVHGFAGDAHFIVKFFIVIISS